MPFDPLWPQNGHLADGDKLREQFTALKTLIDAGGGGGSGATAAQVDGVNTTDPTNPALANVSLIGDTLHFTFTLPRGNDGQQGQPGTNGSDGGPGPQGPQGPQGPPFAQAIIDAVTTLNPGEAATAGVMFDGSNVRFTFGIPRGADGAPGQVTAAQLDTAIAGTSGNTNAVGTLDTAPGDPPSLADYEALRAKLNELILNGRR